MPQRPPASIEQQQYVVLEHILQAVLSGNTINQQIIAELKRQTSELKLQTQELKLQTTILREIANDLTPSPDRTETAQVSFGGDMSASPGTHQVGSTIQAVFQPLEADGVTITPGSTLTTPPQWSSDNPAVATVDPSSGVVTGVSAGTANITGTGGVFTDNDGTATAPLTASNSDSVTQPTFRTVTAQVVFV